MKKESKLEAKYDDLIEQFLLDKPVGREIQKVKDKLKFVRQDINREMRKDLSERLGDRYEVQILDTTWK